MAKLKTLTLFCVLYFVSSSGNPLAALASQVVQLDLAFTAQKAGVVFAGAVDSIGYSMDPSGETALTLVHFRDVTYAKGDTKSSTLTLTLRGGRTDKDWSEVVDQPVFENSNRYVVLAKSDLGSKENLYLPIIGLNAGFFPLIFDSTSKTFHVHDWEYRPIVRVQGHHLVVVDRRRQGRFLAPSKKGSREPSLEILGQAEDPGTRMDEEQFMRTVRTFARK